MLRYLDASVVIDGTDPGASLFAKVSPAIYALDMGERCASELVRLECLVQPTRAGDTARISLLKTYFKGLVVLPMDRNVYDLAIDLRPNH